MRCIIELNQPERLTLQQLSLNHRDRESRNRAAGLLLLDEGLSPREIAAQLFVSQRVIYDWFHAWTQRGVCGLLTRFNGGRPRALTPEMLVRAVAIACAESLSLAGIAQKLEAEFGPLPCTHETLGIALKREGLTYKRSRFSLKKKR